MCIEIELKHKRLVNKNENNSLRYVEIENCNKRQSLFFVKIKQVVFILPSYCNHSKIR